MNKWTLFRTSIVIVSAITLFNNASNAFTDESDPQVADMDKEEARLNELNKRLSALNETYASMKRVHAILIKNELVSADSSAAGEVYKKWKISLSSLLARLKLDIDTYIIAPASTNYDDNEDAYNELMKDLREEVFNIKDLQHTQRLNYFKIEKILESVNVYIAKTEIFDDTYLNGPTGEDYSEFVKQVNSYTKRIQTAVYDLNAQMDELSVDSINSVIEAYISTLKITNEVYAIGVGDLSDSVEQAKALVEFSDFIQIRNKEIVARVNETYRFLNDGRISAAESSIENVVSQIAALRADYEATYIALDQVLESNHPLYEVHKVMKSNLASADADYERLRDSILWSADYLAYGMEGWIYNELKSGGELQRNCSMTGQSETQYGVYTNGVLEKALYDKADINCKVAKEMMVFFDRDLTALAPYETKGTTRSVDDLVIDRIRLLEMKMDSIYLDEGL